MKKVVELFVIFCTLFLLTGCWDQILLKNTRLILAASFDKSSGGRVVDGVTTPIISSAGPENRKESVELLVAEGLSPRDARLEIDNKTSQKLDASKLLVLLIGSEMASEDIYSVMDVFYRDPKSALSAKVAIVDGKGLDVLESTTQSSQRPGNVLTDLINSAESISSVSKEDIQSICAEMFDTGVDFLVPYLKILPGEEVKVDGMAMFHNKSFSGMVLTPEESRLFLLLKNKTGKSIPFTYKLEYKGKETFVSFKVKSYKSKVKVIASDNKIKVPLRLEVDVKIDEFPEDALLETATVKELTKLITDHFNEDVTRVIKKLQEANCDGLGIENRLQAFHPDVWKKADWNKEYKNVSFQPEIKVKVVQHGVID
ncbi:Ger(x)C family spore germination protein [Bacillus salacetis]|uniref:Ger(X)C family spore germination protein n=1 Tax=Bacillus salacetis TaxID=2315464 RepID=A0A3A1QZE9_9BACI|nr:Ger(x)C family spore germination protein [Bacillus salacetis]RIW34666.1 Ger(x)C family spore germination protein [Bacillus salacetis]